MSASAAFCSLSVGTLLLLLATASTGLMDVDAGISTEAETARPLAATAKMRRANEFLTMVLIMNYL
jgi:hypothetical protein